MATNRTLVLHFVQQVDNDVGLVNSVGVEVLPHGQSQLVFGHSSLVLRSCHGGRVFSDAVAEHSVGEGVFE